ncbi:unnamed protein product [Onchocerca flexuosa]|uniref:Nudix hydrolase domain-containing protein n=1 Tax=Onchocerca flexuosa TaxID=387005 RepID=A0A183HG11_9BILA|nr:unnamed protein product [Onchocerca flexuosa]
MYGIFKRWSSTSVCRIALDERLREQFCERLKQQSMDSSHLRHLIHGSNSKESAVLIPLVYIDGSPSIIFTHRSLLLNGHRGEVSFPGGRLEQDETYEQAALRESAEEIGLDSCQVKVWGCLRHVTTPTQNSVNIVIPVVGLVQDITNFNTIEAKCAEVQTVFAAPIDELCMKYRYTRFRRDDKQYKLPVFFTSRHHILATNVTPQNEYRIWGLTARMLHLALLTLFPKFYQPKMNSCIC